MREAPKRIWASQEPYAPTVRGRAFATPGHAPNFPSTEYVRADLLYRLRADVRAWVAAEAGLSHATPAEAKAVVVRTLAELDDATGGP